MATTPASTDLEARVAALDWPSLHRSLWERGYAATSALLDPGACLALAATWDEGERFRSHVVMARHRLGEGDYKYFREPLPTLVGELRRCLYRRLAPLANAWAEALGDDTRYPDDHEDFAATCRAASQSRPTPLLLRYTAGGYNRLHQDLYGRIAFPLQTVVVLDRAGVDYDGGRFLLVESRPRTQSRGEALEPARGEAVIFTTRFRPERGAQGFRRVAVRHGLSTVTRGTRHALGLVYHDAE
jgi:hypothetical protein